MTTASISGSGTGTLAADANPSPALAAFTPEFRLMLACLRWPQHHAELAAVAESAQLVRDWPHLVAVSTRHRVAGLVWRSLQRADCDLPVDTAAVLERFSAALARQTMLLTVESLRLTKLLSTQGVDALFLKGATVNALAYEDLTLRHAKDIDLLVPEAQLQGAMAVLRGAGYASAFDMDGVSADRRELWFRYAKSMDWTNRTNGVQLELHWRLTDLPLLRGALASDRRQTVAVAGDRTLETLDPDHLLAYLCVHGAAHGWMRLKWLADVYALLPHGDGAPCERTYRRLVELGAGRSAGQALLLCHDLLRYPLPVRLAYELGDDAMLQVLRRSALRLLARGGEVDEVDNLAFGTTSVYLSRLLLGSGPQSLVSELRTWGYRSDEMLKTRLPRSLLFLFPLVRVGSWFSGRLRHGGRSPNPH